MSPQTWAKLHHERSGIKRNSNGTWANEPPIDTQWRTREAAQEGANAMRLMGYEARRKMSK